MKIIFIVPSKQWLQAAGVRIRYKRLEPFFSRRGCEISISPIQDISNQNIENVDIVIFSKIFSKDSIYVASLCRSLGVKVGIDLFDDYFSDKNLSVFRKMHDWLEFTARIIDFVICSTDRMKQVASAFIASDSIHKINDTKDPGVSYLQTQEILSQKMQYIASNRSFNILWFGIGDNPYFNVGLKDLANYSNALFNLNKLSSSIEFTILTNERALTAKNLIRIARLPIQPKVEIWSEAKEKEYLKNTHLALMPVSHQKFSIAKSTNRCLTALTYGSQVLSNGFNLYQDFSELIYNHTADFVADYQKKRFRFNSGTVSVFEEICESSYDCGLEVDRFLHFIEKKVLSMKAKATVKFCLVNTNSSPSQSTLSYKESQFPVIDGQTLRITNGANFGIEKYNGLEYFIFSDNSENLLLNKWSKHVSDIADKTGNKFRSVQVRQVEKISREAKIDVRRVMAARFTKLDKNNSLLQRQLHQSFIYSSLCNLVKLLFGIENLFFSDPHNKIAPFRFKP